ncbi:glycine-rich domain-containing protein [Kaistella carnis]|uniref:glycine-rich domain-containing protein n=2 Tax=Kaistella carnis TaxID=1241979 RepID=UPI0028AB4698|nr:T9SS type A sorting domain-containing protein [Kaistella carnis]
MKNNFTLFKLIKNFFTLKYNRILFVLLLLFSICTFGQTSQEFNTPGTFTFTVPSGVTSIKVEAWGSGAGGSRSNGKGGGGGAFAGNNSITVTPSQTYTVIVGAGAATGSGANGQDSKFGALVIAKGALGATGGLSTGSTGAISFSGGNGGRSTATGGAGGGGSGGAGGIGGNGADTTNNTGGVGGTAGIPGNGTGGAAGGNGGNNNNSGAVGQFPGGGGGERGNSGGSSGGGGNGRVIITYTPPYLAKIISANTGSPTWCRGEKRNVSVTIKNMGTAPWTDGGGKDFNVGVKWNQNGTSWNDYNVRTDAKNLAPGNTETYNFIIEARENVGGVYGNDLASGSNNLTFDVVYEAESWFGNNQNGVGPGNSVLTVAQTISSALVPKNYTIQQTVSPTGATACSEDYVKLDISGMPPTFSFKEEFTPKSYSWTKTIYGTAPNYFGIDITSSSNTASAGGLANEGRFFSLNDNYNTIADWSFYPDTGTVGDYRPISLDGYNAVNLLFKSRFQSKGTGLARNIYVEISTDAVNWSTIWSRTGIGNNVDITDSQNVNLSAYLGSTIYLRFRYNGNGTGLSNWYLDDIIISGTIPPVVWSPNTGLYTDSGLTTPYTGGNVTTLYAAPNGSQEYTVSSSISACSKSTVSTVVHNKKKFTATTGNWDGNNNWFPTGAPLSPTYTDDRCINIPNGKSVVVNVPNAIAKSVTVDAGGKLAININQALTVTDAIINNATAADFIVASDANLLQVNDAAVNTGSITVKRNANMKRLDYTYWASPVSGQNLKNFSPGTLNNRFLTYNENNDYFVVIDPIANNFANNGKGYAIRAYNTYGGTPQVFAGNFVGIPNNGLTGIKGTALDFTDANHGYNLVGNPYASNLNFDFLHANNSALIYNTAYFWTNINPNPPMQGSGYPGTGIVNNYAVLNGTGGVGATSTAPVGGTVPNQFIKVGQGFIVKSKKAGNLDYKNTIRTSNGTGHFFNKDGESAVDRYWLHLTTPLDVLTTQLIGYKAEATNGFELDYDAPLYVLGADAFYSILDDKKLAIQGKGPFVITDVVPLGSNHYETGNYTISLGNKEGVFANGQNIYLKDKQTGTVTNLSERSYTFTANQGLTDGRFDILYQPEVVLGTGDSSKENLVVYRDGNDFVVKSSGKNITGLEVYDVSGRLMITSKPNQKETRIDASAFINGVYVLKINQEGIVVTKKVIK